MKNIIKNVLLPVIFVGLIDWSVEFDFINIGDFKTIFILLGATAILLLIGPEDQVYGERFKTSLFSVGFILLILSVYRKVGENTDNRSIELILSTKPILLCLIVFPPLQLLLNNYDRKRLKTSDGDSEEGVDQVLWKSMLTRRETEVYEYVARHHTNGEIAEKLFISELTVKKHVQNIMKKADVNTRDSLYKV